MRSKPENDRVVDLAAVERQFKDCLAGVTRSLRCLESAVPALVRAHRDGARGNTGPRRSLPKNQRSRKKKRS